MRQIGCELLKKFNVCYFEQRDKASALALLSDDVQWFGTSDFERVCGKAAASAYFDSELRADTEKFKVEYKELVEQPCCADASCALSQLVISNSHLSLPCRMGVTVRREGDVFLICAIHMSVSNNTQQPGEYFPNFARPEIKKSEFFQQILNGVPGGVHTCRLFEPVGAEYLSEGYCSLTGYSREEIMEHYKGLLSQLVYEPDREQYKNVLRGMMDREECRTLRYRIRCKDGRVVYVYDFARSLRLPDGRMWAFSNVFDMTENERLRYESDSRQQILEHVFEHSRNLLYIWHPDTNRFEFSKNFHDIFNMKEPEFFSRECLSAVADNVFHDIVSLLTGVFRTGEADERELAMYSHGVLKWFRITCTRLINTCDDKPVIAGIILDIDAQKKEYETLLTGTAST